MVAREDISLIQLYSPPRCLIKNYDADFGEMFTAGGGMATTSDGSRGMMCGGEDLTGSSHYLNIGTLGKSIEFGDLDKSITAPAGPGGAVSGG